MQSPSPLGVVSYEQVVTRLKSFTVYVIQFDSGDVLKRRYSEFRHLVSSLPDALRKQLPPFPPMTGVGSASEEVQQERCKCFDSLVKAMWADPVIKNLKEVQHFFTVKELVQAGGHGNVHATAPGWVTKKTDEAELDFYRKIDTLGIPPLVRERFFPFLKEITDTTVTMEDLTYGYDKACLMDIKMGTITAGENANFFKKSYMVNKDKKTTSVSHGMRIVASRYYESATDTWHEVTRADANGIHTNEDLWPMLTQFFTQRGSLPTQAMEAFLPAIRELSDWFEGQALLRFYSSSLLFVYEGNPNVPFRAGVKMIDFAHVFHINDAGRDAGYCKGLQFLIKFMSKHLGLSTSFDPPPLNAKNGEVESRFEYFDPITRSQTNKTFTKIKGSVSKEIAQECVEWILSKKVIDLEIYGAAYNTDMIKSSTEQVDSFLFWIYGGGKYQEDENKNYHYLFGIRIFFSGEVQLTEANEELWAEIVQEYGPDGCGGPAQPIIYKHPKVFFFFGEAALGLEEKC